MWSAPYNQDYYDNYYAVGINGDWDKACLKSYQALYYDNEDTSTHFQAWDRKDAHKDFEKLEIEVEGLAVECTFTNLHAAKMNLAFKPTKSDWTRMQREDAKIGQGKRKRMLKEYE